MPLQFAFYSVHCLHLRTIIELSHLSATKMYVIRGVIKLFYRQRKYFYLLVLEIEIVVR